jgi:Tfp pilus assembly protein PilF
VTSLFRDWDWDTAQREVQRALELDPNCLSALYARAVQLSMMGRHEASRQFMQKALDLDPVNVGTRTLAAELLVNAHRYDKAETELRQVIEMDPAYERAHEVLASLYEARGQGEEAAKEYAKGGFFSSEEVAGVARAFRAEGMHGFYARTLDVVQHRHPDIIFFAHVYAGLGDHERALQYLEKALQERHNQLLFCKVDPWLDPLRSDARFQDFLRRLNIPQ